MGYLVVGGIDPLDKPEFDIAEHVLSDRITFAIDAIALLRSLYSLIDNTQCIPGRICTCPFPQHRAPHGKLETVRKVFAVMNTCEPNRV